MEIPRIQRAHCILPRINSASLKGSRIPEGTDQRGVTDDFSPINDDTAYPRVILDGYFNMTPR